MDLLQSLSAGTIVFGILIPGVLGLASAILAVCGFADLWIVHRRRKWPTASGSVVASEILTPHRRGCRPFITYRFQANGYEYQSSNFFHGQANSGYSRPEAERRIAGFPPGTPVTVHYDPADPHRSVVVIRTIFWKFMLGSALFAIAAAGSAVIASVVEFFGRR
ncbi:MAG: DUF3592 domain-containing protein [Acidobacteria bacterium]|nr:DUF3592 domain-containing protein [Acidobacteriota bacterium]MBK8149646.1 DUF3592 domain-containing protein [Acidobacteriota bacterium]MBK8809766.1 DUF3592 domain-containing protein [Acidobacteriota bacterium]